MMATRPTKNGSSKVLRRGSVNAEGTPISEMLKREFLIFGVPKQIFKIAQRRAGVARR
jgi:hypothetical protein